MAEAEDVSNGNLACGFVTERDEFLADPGTLMPASISRQRVIAYHTADSYIPLRRSSHYIPHTPCFRQDGPRS